MKQEVTAKKVFLRTLGCQMNLRDSEVIAGLLKQEGYELVADPALADVVLFNTCSVRKHAEERVWSQIGEIAKSSPLDLTQKTRQINTEGIPRPTKKIVGLVGCMAQNYKAEIFKRAACVDIVCGPGSIDRLPGMIDAVAKPQGHQATRKKQKNKIFLQVSEKKRPEWIYHTGFYEKKDHAYIVISEGCENYCSYCIVPYTRGRLKHRPCSSIIREVKEAVKAGIVNVTLLGQNVTGYKYVTKSQGRKATGEINFVGLLKKVCGVKGLESVTFMTSHPKDVTVELFKMMAQTPIIKKSLHLPLQSGSDKILKVMNRGYTVKKYLEIIDQFKKIVYNGQISTDIIIGFPGETDEDFQKTFDVVKSIGFDNAFIFKYSPREGTKAYSMKNSVPEDAKKKRHAKLLELQREISKKKVLTYERNNER